LFIDFMTSLAARSSARDDKKERVVAGGKGGRSTEAFFKSNLGRLTLTLTQGAFLGGDTSNEKSRRDD
jgi:hypothetical protein